MGRTLEFLDLPVERIMTRHPETVGAEQPLGDAAGQMVSGGYRHLPVVDTDGRLVGMLSERDLRARLGSELERFPDAGRQLLGEPVETVMRPDPITARRSAPLRDVLEILVDDRVGALPITEDGEKLVGIVSYVDVLAALGRPVPARATPPRRPRAEPRARSGKRASRARAAAARQVRTPRGR